MEGNKEEAVRCRALGEQALRRGDPEKALKMLKKSLNMYPTPEAHVLMREAEEVISGHSNPQKEDGPRKRPTATTTTTRVTEVRSETVVEEETVTANYTPEQVAACNKVIKCNDYYQLLSVSKDATDDQIKKAYRKLALQFHPDKNRAPRAEEAFKKVSQAFTCLSDSKKRAVYDQFGNEDPAAQYRKTYEEEEVSPEDLFNMFFGSDFQSPYGTRVFRRQWGGQPGAGFAQHFARARHSGDHQTRVSPGFNILQLMPLALLLLLSFLSNYSRSDPPYSLTPTSKHAMQRVTIGSKIPYYVEEGFDENYARNTRTLRQVESNIEGLYLERLHAECINLKRHQQRLVNEAKRYSGEEGKDRLAQAKSIKLQACDDMKQLQSYLGYQQQPQYVY